MRVREIRRWGVVLLLLVSASCGESDDKGAEVTAAKEAVSVPAECLVDVACVDDTDCGGGGPFGASGSGPGGTRCNTTLSPPQCQKLYCGPEHSPCNMTELCEQGLACRPKEGGKSIRQVSSKGKTWDPPVADETKMDLTCQQHGTSGEGCRADEDCQDDLLCSGDSGNDYFFPPICGTKLELHPTCFDDKPCEQESFVCKAIHCEPPSYVGEPCSSSGDCAEGLLCYVSSAWSQEDSYTCVIESLCDKCREQYSRCECY